MYSILLNQLEVEDRNSRDDQSEWHGEAPCSSTRPRRLTETSFALVTELNNAHSFCGILCILVILAPIIRRAPCRSVSLILVNGVRDRLLGVSLELLGKFLL